MRTRIIVCALLALALLVVPAAAQDLQSELEHKRDRLGEVKEHEGVLSTTIERMNDRIDVLIGQVAVLRNREDIVERRLAAVQAKLHEARVRLEQLHTKLHRSLGVLRNRLVDIYRSSDPDMLTVLLDSNGFDDLVTRFEYLRRVETQDADIVGSVRALRDRTEIVVEKITEARDEIAARQAELERTRTELEARQGQLDAARSNQRAALSRLEDTEQELEGDVSAIQDKIAAQVAAAQQAAGVPAPAAGPYQGESSEGFIWPVNGPVVSPFGPRNINGGYENHPGIDIAIPSGTPIKASANGTVLFTQPEASSGGYGNYTCIDHGGGISTCYAHQSSFAVAQGDDVSQGEVIGYSDCTGYCFGPHLHFEVRINGTVTDPMAYLP